MFGTSNGIVASIDSVECSSSHPPGIVYRIYLSRKSLEDVAPSKGKRLLSPSKDISSNLAKHKKTIKTAKDEGQNWAQAEYDCTHMK